jgi:hypothetical protein
MLWNRVNLDVEARYERKGSHKEGQHSSINHSKATASEQ